jgi:hypothetical protein
VVAAVLAPIIGVAYMWPGPTGFAQSPAFADIRVQAEAENVTLNTKEAEALNRLALVLEGRTDLQAAFGTGTNLNVRALLEWVVGQPDSDAKSLQHFVPQFQALIADWDAV